jgi:polar amino acid transport system substrate-binding protein
MGDMARRMIVAAAAILLPMLSVNAREAPTVFHVATRILPPFVQKEDGRLTGFSIDLWNALAARMGATTEFVDTSNIDLLLDAVHSGKADLGIATISITADRDKSFDFSQPMLAAGLQILVRGKSDQGAPNPLQGLMRLLFSPMILVWLGIAGLLIIIPAHIVWLVERGRKDGIIPNPNYFPGIFHALWWAAGTLATQADQMPRHWLARVVAVLWMFTAVIFVAYYTAQLTAALTVEQIHGDINGPDDLPGKRVATTLGSTAAAYLREEHARLQEFSTIDEAYRALLDNSVDAVVFDAPVLLFSRSTMERAACRPQARYLEKRITASYSQKAVRSESKSTRRFLDCAKTVPIPKSIKNGSVPLNLVFCDRHSYFGWTL